MAGREPAPRTAIPRSPVGNSCCRLRPWRAANEMCHPKLGFSSPATKIAPVIVAALLSSLFVESVCWKDFANLVIGIVTFFSDLFMSYRRRSARGGWLPSHWTRPECTSSLQCRISFMEN